MLLTNLPEPKKPTVCNKTAGFIYIGFLCEKILEFRRRYDLLSECNSLKELMDQDTR